MPPSPDSSAPSRRPAGKKLEALIRKAAVELEGRDLARIWQWPVAMAVTRRAQQCGHCGSFNEGFDVLFRERTGGDFFGYTAGGRVILVEAKERKAPSLAVNDKILKPHQLTALRDCERAGGIALLMWMRNGLVATIDVPMIERLLRGRKSLPWREIDSRYIHETKEPARLFWPWIG